jgi:O-acetyl-ADP-ribose deacetylase (regulator of RNase III)
MIVDTSGDLLQADVDVIVNTVNCVGVMGKGVALQVKHRYPAVFAAYERECRRGNVRIGRMLPVPTNELSRPAWVINFPTKTDWRLPSRLSYISAGLPDLLRVVKELDVRSIVIPALGAGNGGLDLGGCGTPDSVCLLGTK